MASDSLVRVLTLPGLSNSGPDHWQTRWEQAYGFTRVEQDEWDRPVLSAWLSRLGQMLERESEPVVLVAHSLGAALAVHAATTLRARIRGALLVAPADVEDPTCTPEATRSFAPLPRGSLGFQATVVTSSNDPYVSAERAAVFARAWGAQLVDAGPLGHINAESGLGDWPAGLRLLETIRVR